MDHLPLIRIDINKLHLGFDVEHLKYISWKTYADTWWKVDEGKTLLKDLPLSVARIRYYSSFSPERLEREAELLNINEATPDAIAYGWMKRHIELYESIRKLGFKPKLRGKPITVRIADNGTLEVTDGNNTVSILKHLGYKHPVYAEVSSRAQGWMAVKDSLKSFYGRKLLYQPSGHPDLADWEVDRECVDRWNIIKPALGELNGKSVLDIGCNSGWFSRELAGCGAKVTGTDPDRTSLNLARCLSSYHGFNRNNPLYLNERFEDVLARREKYDVALLLSVIHHYIRKNPQEAWSALDLINRKCDKLILELGVNNLPIKWKPELVTQRTQYKKFRTLFDGERPIYLYSN